MRRFLVAAVTLVAAFTLVTGPAWACGGLIGPNGAVNLVKTTTLAAYHDGIEHYLTAFSFAGGSGEFGSIVPLPAIPTKVERGGDWTLQRLVRETNRVLASAAATTAAGGAAPDKAEVILETKVDALDITVLKGGGTAVGDWAREHGFRLPPDAPEVLEFYAARSPIFLAARFDADAARARGQQIGDGTPVHITMPTDNPWVPLRILALGKQAKETVEADVYLLTDNEPVLLPNPVFRSRGLFMDTSERARDTLTTDLRADAGMEWMPATNMWLTHLRVQATASQLNYDLAADTTGRRSPSTVAAGLEVPGGSQPHDGVPVAVIAVACAVVAGVAGGLALAIRRMAA